MYLSADGSMSDVKEKVGMFTFKPFDEIASYYLLGSPDDVVPKLQARIDAGVTEIAINFIDPNPTQLELFVDYVLPRLRSVDGNPLT
jgi:alkanesulfonate monooxygenase SsuD/methylene tetrahydromethanopterin reductase-like flavin-dependent oxidoreductase (luciferase family)